MRWLVWVSISLMVGCAGFRTSNMSPEELMRAPLKDVCNAYYLFMTQRSYERAKAELQRREAFTTEQWNQIANRQIFKGMPVEQLWCTRSYPKYPNGNIETEGDVQVYSWGIGCYHPPCMPRRNARIKDGVLIDWN